LSGDTRVGPPAPHILETEVEGEISLYDPRKENVTILNGTASDVWLLCDGTRSTDEIVELLASSYGVDAGQIKGEVTATIDQFVAAGLLPE